MQQQLYKSLSLLICIEIARFLIINFIGYIGQVEYLSDDQKRTIITLLSCFISVLTSSEVPILVFTRQNEFTVKYNIMLYFAVANTERLCARILHGFFAILLPTTLLWLPLGYPSRMWLQTLQIVNHEINK